jgi:hypothetical protein
MGWSRILRIQTMIATFLRESPPSLGSMAPWRRGLRSCPVRASLSQVAFFTSHGLSFLGSRGSHGSHGSHPSDRDRRPDRPGCHAGWYWYGVMIPQCTLIYPEISWHLEHGNRTWVDTWPPTNMIRFILELVVQWNFVEQHLGSLMGASTMSWYLMIENMFGKMRVEHGSQPSLIEVWHIRWRPLISQGWGRWFAFREALFRWVKKWAQQ